MKVLYGFFKIFSLKRFLFAHKEGSFDDRSHKRQHRNWRETENETKFKKNWLAQTSVCVIILINKLMPINI